MAMPPLGEFHLLEVVNITNRWRPLGDHLAGGQLWDPSPIARSEGAPMNDLHDSV